MSQVTDPGSRLARRLSTFDATAIGLGAMLGAGVFVAYAPAAEAAGAALLLGVLLAGAVAYANANSSARLAAIYPESGGTYVYGQRRLGHYWGFIAGWGFIVGKIASCTAAALAFGHYAWPSNPQLAAPVAAAALTAVNYRGIHRTAGLTKVLAGIVLAVLAVGVVATLGRGVPDMSQAVAWGGADPFSIVQAAGIMFFAFAGYARIATLGEEVRNPARAIPSAVHTALAVTLLVYLVVGGSLLATIGSDAVAASNAPLLEAATDDPGTPVGVVVRAGAAIAGLSVLLALLAGISRTAFAMADSGDLPRWFAAVHPRFHIPHRAELAVGLTVIALSATVEIRSAIAFSAFTILLYYAIANASALTLREPGHRHTRALAAFGVAGCVVLALSLPAPAVTTGTIILAVGTAFFVVRQRRFR